MSFQQIQKLDVKRKLSDGSQVIIGELAQNRQGVYFQYNDEYLNHYSNLSPFNLSFDSSVNVAIALIHKD